MVEQNVTELSKQMERHGKLDEAENQVALRNNWNASDIEQRL